LQTAIDAYPMSKLPKEQAEAFMKLANAYEAQLDRLITFERTGTTEVAPELNEKWLAKLERRLDRKTKGRFAKTSLDFGIRETCGADYAALLGN
jgi:hypothetical protein